MNRVETPAPSASSGLPKVPTGIQGLDDLTNGGLPQGRPTLICGAAGCGKTLLGMEFLVRGATRYGEPGVFMAFEETAEELVANVGSLGFDLPGLCAAGKLVLDHVRVERSEIEETGEYDLSGLFVRIELALNSVGARRIVLDTLESLFAGFDNAAILRAELRRLFSWLKEKGVTAIITAERGDATLTRQGLEEYVSDCVILLDNRVEDQVSTRRLRIVKYRGSAHETNEFPFLLDQRGVSVLPITSAKLDHAAPLDRVSTGVPRLDAMLGGLGVYRGGSILVTGTAGTGKSSLAAHFTAAACGRGERCLLFAFEESPRQIVRNMRSIGIDLQPSLDEGVLQIHASRASLYGLEMHLVSMQRTIADFQPQVVVFDPITNLMSQGTPTEVKGMLTRLIDCLKADGITAVFTSLTLGGFSLEQTDVGISSLMDTWILLRELEADAERTRALYLLKSRGMAHSNQVREFLLTDQGVELVDVYTGSGGVLTGAARQAQEARDRAEALVRRHEMERKQNDTARRRQALEAQITALRAELEAGEEDLQQSLTRERLRLEVLELERGRMAAIRSAVGSSAPSGGEAA